jgi:phage terminase small subunit
MSTRKLTAQQEAFAQAYVKANGKRGAASNAYRAAYPGRMGADAVASNAKKLLRSTPIRLRIEEIRQERECDPAVQVAADTPKDTGLTVEQERFCQHYALHFNAAEAYGEGFAGSRRLKPQSRAEAASRLLANNDKVQARIEALRARVVAAAEKKFDISIERCMAEYARMGLANMESYVERLPDGTARLDLTKVGRDEMAAVQEMTFETVMSSDPNALDAAGQEPKDADGKPNKVAVLKTKFKLHDKKGPLDSIMKHLGGFEKDNDQRGRAAGQAAGEVMGEKLSELEVARRVAVMLSEAARAVQQKPSGQQGGV